MDSQTPSPPRARILVQVTIYRWLRIGRDAYPQQTRVIQPMLFQCWASGEDDGPTLKQLWVNVSYLLRLHQSEDNDIS